MKTTNSQQITIDPEWEQEDNERHFYYMDLPCQIKRHLTSGALCGYVYLPQGHELYGLNDEELAFLLVHGGITWTQEENGQWVIGFDCSQIGDYQPQSRVHEAGEVYRNMDFVEAQLRKLVMQVINY